MNAVNLSKKDCFIITLLHVHLQYVCKMPAKYKKDTLRAVGGVVVTKYAYIANIIQLELQSSIPLAMLIIQSIVPIMRYINVWC